MTPDWKLPPGVPRGVWDYVASSEIATEYDAYHGDNPLFAFEAQVLGEEFTPPGLVADLGCGSGRALLPLVRAGHRGLAIDLSQHMLEVVRQKAAEESLDIRTLQANLVELGEVADQSIDYAMCLFSTLGMIRGRENRRQCLAHVRRMLKPGGKFVLHVHNFWFNLYDPGGPWWVLRSLLKRGECAELEVGDKFFPYRGVPNFFLHVFRNSELRRDLASAGFKVRRWIPLEVARRHALRWPWLLPNLARTGGSWWQRRNERRYGR